MIGAVLRVGLLALVTTTCAVSAASAAPHVFDPASPRDNIEAWVKLAGDTSGRPSFRVTRMVAYAVPEDSLSRPLFALRSISRSEYRRLPEGGFESRSLACGAYFDAASGAPITSFADPLDGKQVAVAPFCGKVSGERISAVRGLEMTAAFPMESSIFGRPYLLDWQIEGRTAHVERVAHTIWTEPGSGRRKAETSVDSFDAPVSSLTDPRVTSIDVPSNYTLVTEWMTAMKLAGRPGKMLWLSRGSKLHTAAALPADLLAAIAPVAQGRMVQPLKW